MKTVFTIWSRAARALLMSSSPRINLWNWVEAVSVSEGDYLCRYWALAQSCPASASTSAISWTDASYRVMDTSASYGRRHRERAACSHGALDVTSGDALSARWASRSELVFRWWRGPDSRVNYNPRASRLAV
jgi:hypothetical protein